MQSIYPQLNTFRFVVQQSILLTQGEGWRAQLLVIKPMFPRILCSCCGEKNRLYQPAVYTLKIHPPRLHKNAQDAIWGMCKGASFQHMMSRPEPCSALISELRMAARLTECRSLTIYIVVLYL